MRYQVEGFGFVHASALHRLSIARIHAAALRERGATDVRVCRYDASPFSDYFEVIDE